MSILASQQTSFLIAELGMKSPKFARRYSERQSELMRRLEAAPQVSSATFAMAVPGDEPSALIETDAAASQGTSERHVRFNRVDVHYSAPSKCRSWPAAVGEQLAF